MSEQIIKCRRCGENLVFINGDRAELNYNFVEKGNGYVWPHNLRSAASFPSNRRRVKKLKAEWEAAVTKGKAMGLEGATRRDEATIKPMLDFLNNAPRSTNQRIQISLNSPIILECICGEKKVVGNGEEVC